MARYRSVLARVSAQLSNDVYIASLCLCACRRVRLQTPEMTNPSMPKTNITIFERLDEGVLGREVCSSGPYTSVPQGVATEPVTLLPNQYGYLVVVSTLEPGIAGKFVLYAYSDRSLDIEAGGGVSTNVSMNGTTSSLRSLSLSSSGGGRSGSVSSGSSGLGGGGGRYESQRPSARFRRQFGSGSGQGSS